MMSGKSYFHMIHPSELKVFVYSLYVGGKAVRDVGEFTQLTQCFPVWRKDFGKYILYVKYIYIYILYIINAAV